MARSWKEWEKKLWEGWRPGDPLYLVFDDGAGEERSQADVWTLSPREDSTGWETDNAQDSYGLPRHVAEALLAAYNRQYGLGGGPRFVQVLGGQLPQHDVVEQLDGDRFPEQQACPHNYVQLVTLDGGHGPTVARCVDCGDEQPIPAGKDGGA